MRTRPVILTTILLMVMNSSFAIGGGTRPEQLSLSELEQRLKAIDAELKLLASYSPRSGVGAVGYDSKSHDHPGQTEWIRIDLGAEHPIDQIILVPSIWRDPDTGLRAEGFPLSFRILAGTSDTTNTIASYTAEDALLPRIAPLAVQCQTPVTASWVKVEATELSPQGWSNRHTLQLSEIMVFSGPENVAFNQPVSVPQPKIRTKEGRAPRFLVDGFVPYLMDAALGESSKAHILRTNNEFRQPTLTIDLEEEYPINQINLHAVDLSHNIPEAAPNGYAMPKRLRVTGANEPDFADEIILFEYEQNSIYDAGPIIIRRFPETACRYVRVTALELQPNNAFQKGQSTMGFAELEVLSKGRNIAFAKPASSADFGKDALKRMLDGNNFFGKILPLRDWMNQLARRHDLETERPLISSELNKRYARQKANLQLLSWLVALLVVSVGFTILILRMLQMRTVSRIRERFAADLHDELGANIHTIGILGDAALRSMDSPERIKELVHRGRELTERTGAAIRHCIDFQEAGGLFGSLPDDMRRTAHRILADLEYHITIEGEELLQRLKPRIRTDLFLFFKECLVNISRHAEASRFNTRLTATSKELQLAITDNGKGLPEGIPHSLKRRAHLLGAKVQTGQSETGETQIILHLKLRGKLRSGPAARPSPANDTPPDTQNNEK